MTLRNFTQTVKQPPIDVVAAALQFARNIAYPRLDVLEVLRCLDLLAAEVLTQNVLFGGIDDQAQQLAHFLYYEAKLKGNRTEFDDPQNSYLNAVLERGLGIPISLSAIYIAVAQRVGLSAYGVGLPGHFIVGIGDADDSIFVDPFNGRRIYMKECVALMRETTGYNGPFRSEWLNPTPPNDIVLRMLNNLRSSYLRLEDYQQVLDVIDHLRVIRPKDPTYLRDEGLVYYGERDFYRAATKLEAYLTELPDAKDGDALKATIGQTLADWSRLN